MVSELSLKEKKKQLRRFIKDKKQQLSKREIKKRSAIIFRTIEEMEVFKKTQAVMVYWSIDNEVHTHDFILKWYKRKTILLPVMEGDNLKAVKFTGREMLRREEKLGIYQPTGEGFSMNQPIDLIIVPGVAFDKNNNRLGRGKAYYDKFLTKVDAFKIGVCFDFQLMDEVPSNSKDVRMDIVITD